MLETYIKMLIYFMYGFQSLLQWLRLRSAMSRSNFEMNLRAILLSIVGYLCNMFGIKAAR